MSQNLLKTYIILIAHIIIDRIINISEKIVNKSLINW